MSIAVEVLDLDFTVASDKSDGVEVKFTNGILNVERNFVVNLFIDDIVGGNKFEALNRDVDVE